MSLVPPVDQLVIVFTVTPLVLFVLEIALIYLSNPRYSRMGVPGDDVQRVLKEAKERKTEALSLLALVLTLSTFALGNDEISVSLVSPLFALSILFLLLSLVSGTVYSNYRITADVQRAGNTYAFGVLLLGLLIVFIEGLQETGTGTGTVLAYIFIGVSLILIVLFGALGIRRTMANRFLWYYYQLDRDERERVIKTEAERFRNRRSTIQRSTDNRRSLPKDGWVHALRVSRGVKKLLRSATIADLDRELSLIADTSDSDSADEFVGYITTVTRGTGVPVATTGEIALRAGISDRSARNRLKRLSEDPNVPIASRRIGGGWVWWVTGEAEDETSG